MGPLKNEAIRIAKLAGMRIKELREKNQYHTSLKDGYELVTSADLISNEHIKSEIAKKYPDHHFLSEEDYHQVHTSIQNPTWIIDPIDGTVGFANDHYQVAVSIAFASENRVCIGVVYNPFLDELFYASEDAGAYLNHKRIKIKPVDKLKHSVIGTGFPHKRDNIRADIETLENLLPNIRDIRRLGSPALDICWVACGRLQGFYERKLQPWDVAAAKLIALEAGARVGYYSAEQNPNIPNCLNGNSLVVSSPGIFEALKSHLVN